MKISLIGYMGSGKSTIGSRLALPSGLEYYDLDAMIEQRTGYTITETIFNKGELYFRKLEREVLHEILTKDHFVLSTGGGTPCYYDNIEVINKHSLSIYLQYGVAKLYERLKTNKSHRPLLAHLEGDALREYIGKHLFERAAYYERAIVTINGNRLDEDQIVEEIKNYLNE